MKRLTRRAATVMAAGALSLGALAGAAAAQPGAGLSDPGPSGMAAAEPGGLGHGMRSGYGNGMCMRLTAPAEHGTLTGPQKSTLQSMAQEEKIAHDLYAAFAARYEAMIFDHIAAAETRHLAAVRTLLQRYGVPDPTADQRTGTFPDRGVQARYDRLLARGETGLSAALGVGRQVERDDIAALKAATAGLAAPDVQQVYTGLIAASQHHLTVFTRWSGR